MPCHMGAAAHPGRFRGRDGQPSRTAASLPASPTALWPCRSRSERPLPRSGSPTGSRRPWVCFGEREWGATARRALRWLLSDVDCGGAELGLVAGEPGEGRPPPFGIGSRRGSKAAASQACLVPRQAPPHPPGLLRRAGRRNGELPAGRPLRWPSWDVDCGGAELGLVGGEPGERRPTRSASDRGVKEGPPPRRLVSVSPVRSSPARGSAGRGPVRIGVQLRRIYRRKCTPNRTETAAEVGRAPRTGGGGRRGRRSPRRSGWRVGSRRWRAPPAGPGG